MDIDAFFKSGTGMLVILAALLVAIYSSTSKHGRRNRADYEKRYKRNYPNYMGNYKWKKYGKHRRK